MRFLRVFFRFIWRFFVTVLAVLGIVVVVAVVAVGFGWQRIAELRAPAETIPETAVLTLDLTDGVSELRSDNPLARASGPSGVVLHEAVDALHAAAGDDRVKALAVRLGHGGVGFAQAQDLHAAVRHFRGSGKPAYAFAETISSGMGGAGGSTVHAYLTSAFDQVWMQPSGDYGLTGFRIESPFLRDLLDELGIKPRVGQREAYKGVANQLTDTRLPAPQRENLQRLLDSWLAQVVAAVSEGRGLPAAELRRLVDSAPLSAEDALEAGLVDRLGYRAEMQAAVKDLAGAGAKPIDAAAYAALREDDLPEDAPRVAVVYGVGAVSLADSEYDPIFGDVVMGSDTVAPAIRAALEDEDVDAIVFRVDSPGGSYVASDAIWHAVQAAREAEKPIVVSMGDIAASGGYFVAAPANRIVAQPGTLTGSIGVVTGKVVLTGLWDKLHVTIDGVQAGERADFWSPNSDFSEAEWQALQQSLDESYADFRAKVAAGRGLSAGQVREAAQGKVFSGADARAMGLVDTLGGFRKAVAVAKELAGIAPETQVRRVVFPEPTDPLREFLGKALRGEIESPAARTLAELTRTLRPVVDLVEVLEGTSGGRRLEAPAVVRDAASSAPR